MNDDNDIQSAINNAGDIGVPCTPYITESEYMSMLTLIDTIMDLDPDPTTPDGIRLSELVRIVEQYESKQYPSLSQEPSTPVYDSYPLWQLLNEEHGLILLNDVRRIALERDRMRHALQKIESESHDARAVDYAEAALR